MTCSDPPAPRQLHHAILTSGFIPEIPRAHSCMHDALPKSLNIDAIVEKTARKLGVLLAFLICSPTAQAVACKVQVVAGASFTVCQVELKTERLSLFWRDTAGRPYRQFSALRDALESQGSKLLFAVNAGMYQPNFSPVGLFVADGHELVPLNRHVGSGNFSQQPNGVFLVEGDSARVMSTADYAAEMPKPDLATQSGPMLVHEGRITTSAVMNPDSSWRKIRNGVCAPSPGTVLFVISESPVTFFDFANLFRDSLHCQEALYLDGSISSLYAPAVSREDHGSEMGPILGVVATGTGLGK
jgi:uncharacterized protein YigE (DUF2233 family)